MIKLGLVSLGKADCCSGGNGSASIADLCICSVQVLECISDSGLDIEPATSILWLLLHPSDGSVLVRLEVRDESLEWEGAQTFNSKNGHIVSASLLPLLLQVVVHLAGAQENLGHLISWKKVWVLVLNHWLESLAIKEVFGGRASAFKSEKLLG